MKIAAIVVTFNRLHLLQECIAALRNQTRKPDEIIVVNNGSTDKTLEWLTDQNDLTVITQKNTGSSGGQYTGIKQAYEKHFDWIWVMDDDTLPDHNCLNAYVEALGVLNKVDNKEIGWLCSKVLWKDGKLAKLNGAQILNWGEWVNHVETTMSMPAKSCSFVSVMFSRKAVQSVGFPIKDYFMWLDDIEYTRRFYNKQFSTYLVLNSIAYHQTPENTDSSFLELNSKSKWKYTYGIRNTPSMLRYKSKSKSEFVLRICEYLYLSLKGLYKSKKVKFLPWFFASFLKGLIFYPKIETPNRL